MPHDPAHYPDPSENKPKGHDSNSAQDLLPFPESRRGWVPMQMLLLSSSSSGGRLRSSQAHLALTPLRFEPSVSIPLSTLSCLKRSKTPRLFWMWLEPELDATLAHPSPQQLLHIPPACPASTLLWCISWWWLHIEPHQGAGLNWNKPFLQQVGLNSYPFPTASLRGPGRHKAGKERGGNQQPGVRRAALFSVSSSLHQLKVFIHSGIENGLTIYLSYISDNNPLSN